MSSVLTEGTVVVGSSGRYHRESIIMLRARMLGDLVEHKRLYLGRTFVKGSRIEQHFSTIPLINQCGEFSCVPFLLLHAFN